LQFATAERIFLKNSFCCGETDWPSPTATIYFIERCAMKKVASRPIEGIIEFVKQMGTVHEAERMIIEAGGMSIFQWAITDPNFRYDLVAFANDYVPSALNYAALLKWFQDNKLERFLSTGSLEKNIKEQEIFYQRFYGKSFRIDRKKIFVDAWRLPAIKVGLKAGSINIALLKATPEIQSEVEIQMTEVEFFFDRIMKPLKENSFRIWAEEGVDRWTNLKLAEFLRRCSPTEPEDFDAEAFKKDWAKEIIRIIKKKRVLPNVTTGALEIIFTSNLVNIPSDQIIVNKNGEIVTPDDRSYVSAIAKNVRVLSNAEGIILASQLFAKDGTYLAPNTWEWRRDLVEHQDKKTSPFASVAIVDSGGHEFGLSSAVLTAPMAAAVCVLPYNFG